MNFNLEVMIKFFRKIRQQLLSQNRFSKYLIYAVGEIVLVVIGILIALQINNWNEEQKNNLAAIEIYKNLQYSLEQDSIAVARILSLQKKSLDAQKSMFLNDIDELKIDWSQQGLNTFVTDIMFGAYSFYPKDAIFNLIVSNNEMDLLKSMDVKRELNNLYEYLYKRYENLDPVVEHKFQYQMNPFVSKKLGFVVEFDSGAQIIGNINPQYFKEYYSELSAECRDLFTILSASNDLIKSIEIAINNLLELIRIELKKK